MEQENSNLFTWNDIITIKLEAPASFSPGKMAVVCGMEQVKSTVLSREFHLKLGDWLYTVEFEDGSSIEVPESYLIKYEEKAS